jgi:hypothetical protein
MVSNIRVPALVKPPTIDRQKYELLTRDVQTRVVNLVATAEAFGPNKRQWTTLGTLATLRQKCAPFHIERSAQLPDGSITFTPNKVAKLSSTASTSRPALLASLVVYLNLLETCGVGLRAEPGVAVKVSNTVTCGFLNGTVRRHQLERELKHRNPMPGEYYTFDDFNAPTIVVRFKFNGEEHAVRTLVFSTGKVTMPASISTDVANELLRELAYYLLPYADVAGAKRERRADAPIYAGE